MGGLDKGLQTLRGIPLVLHVAKRLSLQCATVSISANRNLPDYSALGFDVYSDENEVYGGPLAGIHAGLTHCRTTYLLCAPCDAPLVPETLAQALLQSLNVANADVAYACTVEDGSEQAQPVFCLMHVRVKDTIAPFLASGRRSVFTWLQERNNCKVHFPVNDAFLNINSLFELQRFEDAFDFGSHFSYVKDKADNRSSYRGEPGKNRNLARP